MSQYESNSRDEWIEKRTNELLQQRMVDHDALTDAVKKVIGFSDWTDVLAGDMASVLMGSAAAFEAEAIQFFARLYRRVKKDIRAAAESDAESERDAWEKAQAEMRGGGCGMSGHTPGPWEVEEDGLYENSYIRQKAGTRRLPGFVVEHQICENVGNDADARLIAAAPDLLEALVALFNDYKRLADSGDAGFWKLEDVPEGEQALAAIAKATGAA